VIAVKQNRNHSINAGYWQLGAAPAPFHSLTARNVLTPPTIYTRSDEGMVPLRVVPDINPALVVLTVGADATALHINEAATPFETPGAGMLRGGFIGRCDAGHSGPQDCAAFIVVSRSLTSGELADLKGRAYANHEIRSATTGVVLHVGASTTEGTGSVQNLNLTRFEERAFTDTYPRIYGVGVSAVGIAEMRDQLARFGPLVAAPAQKNILFAFVGGNNINKGMTAADLFSAVSALVSEAGAAGYIPIITTLLPRRTFTDRQREERARFNTLLRASSHRIADFAADPVMGSDAAAADTRLYTDGIHMTSQGYSRLAAISAPVIEQALRS
jgi:lysophospholipase L1-like esterase